VKPVPGFDALLPLLIGMLLYRAIDSIAIRRKTTQAILRLARVRQNRAPAIIPDGLRLMRLGLSRLDAKLLLRSDIWLRRIDRDFEVLMTGLILVLFAVIGLSLTEFRHGSETNSVTLGVANTIAALALSGINVLCESLRARLEKLP
jgi:hypothetical protein